MSSSRCYCSWCWWCWATLGELGVHPLVDLQADPLDQPFGHSVRVVSAKITVRGKGGGDVRTRSLLHADTLHRDQAARP